MLVYLIPHRRLSRRYNSRVVVRSAARDLVYDAFKTRTANARDKLKPPRALRRALRPTQPRARGVTVSLVEGGVAMYRVYRHAAYVSMISAISWCTHHGVISTVAYATHYSVFLSMLEPLARHCLLCSSKSATTPDLPVLLLHIFIVGSGQPALKIRTALRPCCRY